MATPGEGGWMQYLLLVAFFLAARVTCINGPTVAGGLYPRQQPVSVEKACIIMFNIECFRQLPSLVVVEPLGKEDGALLVQAVSVNLGLIFGGGGALWAQWMDAL